MNWLFYGSGDMTIDSSSHSLVVSDISTDYALAKDNCIEKLVANENRIIDILEKLSKAEKGL